LGWKEIIWNPNLECAPAASDLIDCQLIFTGAYQIRNLSRSIWINVAPPPEGAPPPGIKGKTPFNDITPQQLRLRKIEALQLALSFAYAVKHYLREEDGLLHEDYIGVIPGSFARYDETGYNTNMNSSIMSYAATNNDSKNSRDGSRSGRASPDATKRVRAKRSKTIISGSTSPLLANAHSAVEFHPLADHGSMPLPLVIAHELSRTIFKFRREGFLETVGPAGMSRVFLE
jgi:putative membrane protein